MPYAPTVNNTAGQIYAQGMLGAAQAEASGIVGEARIKSAIEQQNAANWAAGIQQAGQGLAAGVSGMIKGKVTADYLEGKFEQQQKWGIWGGDDISKYHEAPLGKKQAMVGQGDVLMDALLKTQQGQQQLTNQKELYNYQQTLQTDVLGQPVKSFDPTTGEPIGLYRATPGSVSEPRVPQPAPYVTGQEGFLQWNPKSQKYDIPITQPGSGQPLTPRQQVDPYAAYLQGGPPQQQQPAGGQQPAAQAQARAPLPADVAYLKAHPEARAQFDAKFGAGASAQYIGP